MTLGSLAWAVWLFVDAWSTLVERRSQIGVVPLMVGQFFAIASGYLLFEAFAVLLRARRVTTLPRWQLGHLYFTAQLLKHLPGRVWGLGYQWAAGRSDGSLADWVLVNLIHVLLSTYFALWGALVVLSLAAGLQWGLLAISVGTAMYAGGWWLASSRIFAQLAAALPGPAGRLGLRSCKFLATTPVRVRVYLFGLFCAGWLIYYVSWFFNGLSYPGLGALDGMRLCAYYMLAWFVGYVSLLTPSGLGIRELVFAWLAKDFPVDVVALMAIVGRTSLLAVDILMGLAFAPFAPRKD